MYTGLILDRLRNASQQQQQQQAQRPKMANVYPLFEAPGMWTRCDAAAVCIPYETRAQFSFDFLCCEDVNWVWAHVINPAFIYLMFGNFYFAWLVAFLYEVAECIILIIYRGYPFGQSTDADLETVSGLLYGDAFVNALIGIIIAKQICTLTGFVSPFSRWMFMRDNWIRFKYLALLALVECSFIFITFGALKSDATTLLSALIIGLTLLVVFRLTTNFPEDVVYVWLGKAGVVARDRTFLMYWIVCVLLALQNCGIQYMANDWYQVWFMSSFIILALLLANKVKNSTS